MLVTAQTLHAVLRRLRKARVLSFDTETTGLRPYHGDRLFALILCDGEDSFYFNFNVEAEDFPLNAVFSADKAETLERIAAACFHSSRKLFYAHNAKFDMHMLAQEGISIRGVVWCTQSLARVEHNDHLSYSLAACAARIGERKDDAVMDWLTENGAWDWRSVPGKDKREKDYHFDLVPSEIIVPYGERDALVTWRLGEHQRRALRAMDEGRPARSAAIRRVVKSEVRLTKTTFHMERRGFPIDAGYCEAACAYKAGVRDGSAARFEALTGEPFKNSGKVFERAFLGGCLEGQVPAFEVKLKETPTGRISFDAEAIEALAKHVPAAQAVLDWRQAKSDLDFYNGFLHHQDQSGKLHANLNTAGTKSGRFSSSSPNLQNLTKPDEESLKDPWVVRRALVPPPGYCLVMMDMDQAEYRLMLDYAGAKGLITKVLGGLDVHKATAELVGTITRQEAKTTNFATLYGAGIRKLAAMLGCTERRAREIRDDIFAAAPEIEALIKQVMKVAENRGYVVNWHGRRCVFEDSRMVYAAVNHMIQGGVADIVKVGMNRVEHFLRGKRSELLLNVHDELVFAFHPTEFELIPIVKEMLEAVYPHRHLPLTWGVDHSWKSLADKVKGPPDA